MREWIKPKIDWKYGDGFDHIDYNRIKNNLLYLCEQANKIYPPEIELPDLGEDKVRSDYFYANEFNAFEDTLERIRDQVQDLGIGNKQIFTPLGKFIGYEERNRIEKACMLYYNFFNKVEVTRTEFRTELTFLNV